MKNIFPFLAVSLLICSCSRQVTDGFDCQTVHFVMDAEMASLDEDLATKTQSEYVVRLKWDETDEISVVNLSTKKILGGTLVSSSVDYTTTFVGELVGSISDGDDLLFIYPAQGNSQEEDFTYITFDFSEQDGTTSSSVPLLMYAVGKAASANGEMSISSRTNQFSFLMSFSYIAMTNLPALASIEDITIDGIPTVSKVSWDYDSGTIVQEALFEEEVGENMAYHIMLASGKSSVSASGNKSFYLTTPPVPADTGFDRVLTVNTVNDDDENEAFQAILSNSRYNAGQSTHRIVSSFMQVGAGCFEESISFEAIFPELVPDDDESTVPEALMNLGWREGDELTAINITTGEILAGRLVASESGATTTLSGVLSGQKGLSEDDELMLIYPALEIESPCDFVDMSVVVDIFKEQDGTIENLPYVISGEFLYGGDDAVQFDFLSSFAHVNIGNAIVLEPDEESVYNMAVMCNLCDYLSVNISIPRALLLSRAPWVELIESVVSDEQEIVIEREGLMFSADNVIDFYFSFPSCAYGVISGFKSSVYSFFEGSPELDYGMSGRYYVSPLQSFYSMSGRFYEFAYENSDINCDNIECDDEVE